MRKWIAVLAFVPAVSWGQASQCTSPQGERLIDQIVTEVMALQESGESRQVVTLAVEDIAPPGVNRKMWMSVVDYAYSRGDDALSLEAANSARAACLRHFTR